MIEFETSLSTQLSGASEAAASDIAGRVVAILQRQEAQQRRKLFGLIATIALSSAVASAIAVASADHALTSIATSASLGWALRIPLAIIAATVALGTSALAGFLMRQKGL